MSTLQRHPDVFGPDAAKFNPDRFDDPSLPKMNIPGMWGGYVNLVGGELTSASRRSSQAPTTACTSWHPNHSSHVFGNS